jgi:hypothetical protein
MNEVVVFGNADGWDSDFVIAHHTMTDALDINGVYACLDQLGIDCRGDSRAPALERIACALVKCEPDASGVVRGPGRWSRISRTRLPGSGWGRAGMRCSRALSTQRVCPPSRCPADSLRQGFPLGACRAVGAGRALARTLAHALSGDRVAAPDAPSWLVTGPSAP